MPGKRSCVVLILTVCFLLAGCSAGKGEIYTKESSEDMQTESLTNDQTNMQTEAVGENETSESESGYPVFYFNSRTVKLNSGYDMPIFGLGTYSLSDSEAENSVYWALKAVRRWRGL